MAKVALAADLQFDLHERYTRPDGTEYGSRLSECLRVFQWIVDEAVARGCASLIVVGDIFESRTVLDLRVLDAAAKAFQYAESQDFQVYAVVGNHDAYLRNPTVTSLRVLSGLADVVTRPDRIKIRHTTFGMVPWADDVAVLDAGIKAVVEHSSYLCTHALIEGMFGSKKGIPLKSLRPSSFKRVFLGDVHDPTDVADNVHYIGAPMQFDFGDAWGKRGFTVLDTDTDTVEYVENTDSPRFCLIQAGEGELLEQVRDIDFVRVKTADEGEARELVEVAKETAPWVEGAPVELPQMQPRLDIHTDTETETLLLEYVRFTGVTLDSEQEEALLSLGAEILEEAK